MTRTAKFLMTAAAAALAIPPAAAMPAAAASVRGSADIEEASELRGTGGILIALGTVAAIIVALIVVGDNDADDAPVSP